MKDKASRNAHETFRAQRTSVQLLDVRTGVIPEEQVDVVGDNGPRIGGEFTQPSLFTGQLKQYELKGMNWMADKYEQVSREHS